MKLRQEVQKLEVVASAQRNTILRIRLKKGKPAWCFIHHLSTSRCPQGDCPPHLGPSGGAVMTGRAEGCTSVVAKVWPDQRSGFCAHGCIEKGAVCERGAVMSWVAPAWGDEADRAVERLGLIAAGKGMHARLAPQPSWQIPRSASPGGIRRSATAPQKKDCHC